MKRFLLAGLLACAALACGAAERAPSATRPATFADAKATETFRMQPRAGASAGFALPALSEAKKAGDSTMAPNQIGVSRQADVGALPRVDQSSLRWEPAAGGFAAHIAVNSPGAVGLRAALRFEAIVPELEIRVAQRAADGSTEVVAKTTGAEINKLARGVLPLTHWTASTEGSVQWIELWSPRRLGESELRFTLFDVSHLVKKVIGPYDTKSLDFSCHVDVTCVADTNVQNDSHAVARMLFTKSGNSYVCSGSLLNDQASSLTPLFASANHCISTADAAATLETWWFYTTTSCNGTPSSPTRLTGGATLLVADFDTDFSFMRLAQNAPGGTTFLGWDTTPLTHGQAIFGLHHPDGSWQRYSAGTFVALNSVTDSDTHVTFANLFNRVLFTQGIIEGGSSGSPLLTAPNIFHGTLFGSPESNMCGGTNNTASYSDFGAAYPLAATWLVGPNPSDDHGNTAGSATSVPVNAKLVAEMNSTDDEDWFRFDFTRAGTWTVSSFYPVPGQGIDVAGAIVSANGTTLVATSDDRSPADLNFEMTLQITGPSTFYVRVVTLVGQVGHYGLRSSFILPDDYGDSANSSTSLPINGSATGRLGTTTDEDWFRLTFPSAGTFRVNSTGPTDTMGALFQSDGVTMISQNDDANPGVDTNFGLTYNVPAAGTLYLRVNGFDGAIGDYGVSTSFTPGSTSTNYTDLWWNSSESGWGINLNHQSDIIFATLFTYAADGRDMWLVASNLARQANGSFTGPLYRTVGPVFNASPWSPVNVTQVGTMTLSFPDANTGMLMYTFNGVSVSKSIGRQRFSTAPSCTFTTASRSGATNYQDLWWNPSESGWGINLTHQGNIIFATLFTYATDNRDMWLVASNLSRQGDGSFSGPLYRTTGPAFNAIPWTPAGVTEVGTMRVAFSDGTNGTLTYTFNGTTVTKSIQRQLFGAQPTICQ